MKKTAFSLIILLSGMLYGGQTAEIRKSGLILTKPPHWQFKKSRGNLLVDIVRPFPGEKQKAARFYIRRVKQGRARLPQFAAMIADSVRKQRMNTVRRRMEPQTPFLHYYYLFQHEPPRGSRERVLWTSVWIFPYKRHFYICYAAARSRRELRESDYIFNSIRIRGNK